MILFSIFDLFLLFYNKYYYIHYQNEKINKINERNEHQYDQVNSFKVNIEMTEEEVKNLCDIYIYSNDTSKLKKIDAETIYF